MSYSINQSKVIGYSTLFDGLFRIELQNNVAYNSIHIITKIKKCVVNEESSMSWYQRLRHMSIRIKKLVNEN